MPPQSNHEEPWLADAEGAATRLMDVAVGADDAELSLVEWGELSQRQRYTLLSDLRCRFESRYRAMSDRGGRGS